MRHRNRSLFIILSLYALFILLLLSCYYTITAHALDLRPTVSPWLEDNTNIYLRIQHNVCVGTGPTATDALSLCTAPVASATRALLNLSNTALSGASANGTYLGANPAVCTGDFFNFQLANVSKGSLTCAGVFTVPTVMATIVITPALTGGAAASSNILYTSTTGTGTPTGIAHQFRGGTNGATIAQTMLNNGNIGIGTITPITKFDLAGSMHIVGQATTSITGSIDTTASTAVVGVGTLFTTELIIGDRITVGAETKTVTVITDATNLTVDAAFTDQANDTTVVRIPAVFTANTAANVPRIVVNDVGSVGISTTVPYTTLHVESSNKTILTLYSLAGGLGPNVFIGTSDAFAIDKGGTLGLGGQYITSSTVPGGFAFLKGGKENSTSANNDGYLSLLTSRSGTGTVEAMRLTSQGRVGIGVAGPTAKLHLAAGSATANTSPLKLNSGTLLTTPEAGSIEFLTDTFYLTSTTGPTRYSIARIEATETFTGKKTFGLPTTLKAYTVAALPAGVVGDIAYVTNALAPVYLGIAAGGGAIVCPVFYNGVNWVTF